MVQYAATDGRGGGQAQPPYLQARSPVTQPVITPAATVAPGEVRPQPRRGFLGLPLTPRTPGGLFARIFQRMRERQRQRQAAPRISPAPGAAQARPPQTPPGQPTAAQSPAQTLYEFFKKDLEGQRRSAMSNAVADASARGVYYGTPLTTSQGDIETEYLRGLGQLQANILQDERQNELQRLQIATMLAGQHQPGQSGGISPEVYQMIGAAFAPRQPGTPSITPQGQQRQQGQQQQYDYSQWRR